MRNFYQKMFANYSPFFMLFMILIVLGSYSIRLTQVATPFLSELEHTYFLGKFGIPDFLLNTDSDIYFKFVLLLSIALPILGYFLGKQIAGKTEGLFIAAFIGFYPYFSVNCYSTSNYFWLFFMLYLLFQLKTSFTMLKKWAILAGIFFALAVIANPICLFLPVAYYAYYLIKARNIGILHNFLFFLLGVLIALSPFMLYALLTDKGLNYIIPFKSVFGPFATNFDAFTKEPLDYFKNSMLPFITNTIGKPSYFGELNSYAYIHYIVITLAILGFLYALIEEKIRVIFIMFLVLFIQALFMPINFGLLFLLIIFMASYMVDKVFHDVFC